MTNSGINTPNLRLKSAFLHMVLVFVGSSTSCIALKVEAQVYNVVEPIRRQISNIAQLKQSLE